VPSPLLLKNAIAELSKQSKAPALDLVFHGQIIAMVAFLQLYTVGDGITWIKASVMVAKVAWKGKGLAWELWV
jgi:hypothetical protein